MKGESKDPKRYGKKEIKSETLGETNFRGGKLETWELGGYDARPQTKLKETVHG